jgi:hypothetical protein
VVVVVGVLWRGDRAHRCQGVSQKLIIRDLNGRDELIKKKGEESN